MKSKLTTVILAFFILAACNTPSDSKVAGASTDQPPFDKPAVKATIDSLNKKYVQALLKGDSAAAVALFTTDGKVMPPNTAAEGPSGMGSMIKGIPASGITKISFITDDIFGNGDFVTEEGHYEMGNASQVFEAGKYLVIWKNENGNWKVHRDIWNANAPPPAKK